MNAKKRGLAVVIALLACGIAMWEYRVHPPVDQTPPPDTNPAITTVTYACDGGKTILAKYTERPEVPVAPGEPPQPTGSADVSLGGGHVETLAQTISADGVRYANADESLVFWSKGDSAIVMRNNAMDLEYTNCATPAGPVSPDGSTAAPASGPITVSGVTVCLPHKDTTGPQTDECAFGIKDDAGRYYSLNYPDPVGADATATNAHVEISGTFAPHLNSKYQDLGTITVSRVEVK